MVFFSKFGKSLEDLFKADKYELNRTFSVKCKNDKTEFTTESGFPAKEGGNTSTKVVCKQDLNKLGVLEVTVPSNKTKKLDYQTPEMMEGLKVNILVEYPEQVKTNVGGGKISLKTEYEKGKIAGKLCAAMSAHAQTLNAEVATEIKGVWLGGSAKYELGKPLEDYSTGVHYRLAETQLGASTNFKKTNILLHKTFCDAGEMGVDWELNLDDYSNKITVGGKYILDDKCAVQGFIRADQSDEIGNSNTYLMYKHKLSDRITASLGTSFDLYSFCEENANVHYKIEMEV